MNSALLLTGLGLLCAGGVTQGRRRADALAKSGRLGTRAERSGRRLPTPALGIVAGTAVVVAVGVTAGVALGLAAAVIVSLAAWMVRDSARRRTADRRQLALLTAIRLIVADLAAGVRPDAALTAAAAVTPEHAAGLHDLARTLTQGGAGSRPATPELAPVGYALDVAGRTGAPLGDVLSRVGDDVEHDRSRRQRVAALTAGPRSSAAMLAVLPMLGLLMGSSIGAGPLHVLMASGTGRGVCCCGIVLDAVGVVWTVRIVRRAEGS